MRHFPGWKIFLIFITCVLGVAFATPNFLSQKTLELLPSWLPSQNMNLGLDLRGGSHLLLEVDFDSYQKESMVNLQDSVRAELRQAKIGYINLRSSENSVYFSIRDKEYLNDAIKIFKKNSDLVIVQDDNKITLQYSPEYLENIRQKLIEQSIEIIRRRVDETGTKEPIIQKQGINNVLLQVPGLDDPEHLKKLLGQTAKMSFHLVNSNITSYNHIPIDTMLLDTETDSSGKAHKIPVFKKSVLNGDLLKNAMVSFDQYSKPVVAFEFNSLGAKLFAEVTSKNIGKQLAIVLDNKVICAPVISVPILGGSGNITGGYTTSTANDLALLLRAGALPAPLKVVEERTVGPSLGAVSIEAGKVAALISVLSVMLFMLIVYGMFGVFANIALIFNLIFLVALLSILQATLTLPGIAGIVLTMGMSVDANVLIFERIYEESKNGLGAFSALDRGFKQAFNTILDSNLTTILVGIFLYSFGSGAVRGFAVTLVLGIATSMFCAITLTRLMASKWLDKFRPKILV